MEAIIATKQFLYLGERHQTLTDLNSENMRHGREFPSNIISEYTINHSLHRLRTSIIMEEENDE